MSESRSYHGNLLESFASALADDLNLSAALAALFSFVKETNILIESGKVGEGDPDRILNALHEVDKVLGVLDPGQWTSGESLEGPSDEAIQALVEERDQARSQRDFGRSDELRDQLAELGVVLEDTPGGTRWKRS